MSSFPGSIYWGGWSFPGGVCPWHLCHKLTDHTHVYLFLGSLFCSCGPCAYFCANTTLFLVAIASWCSLKSVMKMPPAVFSFLRIALATWGPLLFWTNGGIVFCFRVKCHLNFVRDWIECVHSFGQMNILTIFFQCVSTDCFSIDLWL